MKNNQEKIRYFLYARKSSENEDRQVQSIDDQVERLKQLARGANLEIKEVLTESKSAKIPETRPVFSEMLERIKKGEAEGILCWHLNRLTRNPVDSGSLGWLLQQGIIKSIQTMERQYLPNDNVLLFSVETGQANQYLLDLSRDTKRGLQKKLNDGWHPNKAPTGYLNDKEEKTIIRDPERFDLVKRMWQLMLTGSYTSPQITKIANEKWGFISHKTKRMGGTPISDSTVHKIFTSIFYAGIIKRGEVEYQGKHEPMITLEEFDRVQMILGRRGKPRPQRHTFAFTGSIRCGECGCLYTAETKQKFIKSTKQAKNYTYYHCTKKSNKIKCTQNKYVREEALELMIEEEIERLTILPEFLEWALEALNKGNDTEIAQRQQIYKSQQNALNKTQEALDELTRMRYRNLINDAEFLKEKDELKKQLNNYRKEIDKTEQRADDWLELTEKTFSFATYARKAFVEGGLELKKEILLAMGKIPTIKDGNLFIELNEWLKPIAKAYPALEQEYLRLEPKQKVALTGINGAKTKALSSVHTRWLRD